MAESECRSSLVQRVVIPVKDAPLNSVVVYRDRAEVKRRVSVKLEAGENEVKVSHLAKSVDKNSIRVEGLGKKASAAIITDVVYSRETKQLKEHEEEGEEEMQTEHESLKALIKEKETELKHLEFREAVLVREKELLQQFASHVSQAHTQKDSGKEEAERSVFPQLLEGSAVVAMVEFMERYEEKLAMLDRRILEGQTHQLKLKEEVKVLQANANRINPHTRAKEIETIQSVTISLEASENCEVVLLVSYVVRNASWTSSYDVRVFTKDKAMKVQYYGLIKQSTGEDWDNVSIALSTAQPSIGGSAPSLPARIIKFKTIPPRMYSLLAPRSSSKKTKSSRNYRRMGLGIFDDEEEDQYEAACMASRQLSNGSSSPPRTLAVETTKVEAGLFNATFNIPRITTIPADNTEHKVTVALVDLHPQFHYVSRPRLSQYAFLQANAKNTSSYTMLAGPSNVFLDNNFVAKSNLCDVSPSELFNISLGVDQAIRITCQPVVVVRGTARGLSKNKLHTYTHIIKVKNTRTEMVDIEVSEQVPLSTDERIKVNVAEPDLRKQGVAVQLPFGHAVLNASNNIEWHTAVESDKELELRLVYSVEHPPQDSVAGLPKL